jgi:pimeloyl-ACP methyl ester carboxylesterase
MPELKLDERTVVWGRSQGGHSALWTGIIGPRCTPDIKIVGVAAIAPAANMTNIPKINPPVDKRLGPWLAGSYSAARQRLDYWKLQGSTTAGSCSRAHRSPDRWSRGRRRASRTSRKQGLHAQVFLTKAWNLARSRPTPQGGRKRMVSARFVRHGCNGMDAAHSGPQSHQLRQ